MFHSQIPVAGSQPSVTVVQSRQNTVLTESLEVRVWTADNTHQALTHTSAAFPALPTPFAQDVATSLVPIPTLLPALHTMHTVHCVRRCAAKVHCTASCFRVMLGGSPGVPRSQQLATSPQNGLPAKRKHDSSYMALQYAKPLVTRVMLQCCNAAVAGQCGRRASNSHPDTAREVNTPTIRTKNMRAK